MTNSRKVKIIFVITGLGTGGAEAMLFKLVSRINREKFNPIVISLLEGGTYKEKIQALGVAVYNVGMKIGLPTPITAWRLIKLVREFKPDMIQGWMYHGNLTAMLASAFAARQVPILWNIRQSLYSLSYEKKSTATVIKICGYFSRLPAYIIYNSKTSANQHEAIGYCIDKRVIISNGFDVNLFSPSIESGKTVRLELNIPSNAILIGLIGRYHAMKDHFTFLQAASLLLRSCSNVHFLLAGTHVDMCNEQLRKLIKDLNISLKVHLLGERNDIPRLTAALDIAASSSYAEGFSNVIGEAMSCGVPCVVTDVGDSACIVGDTGFVVPPRDSVALAKTWQKLIELGSEQRRIFGLEARQRIIDNFSLDKVVQHYTQLYEKILNGYGKVL